MSANKYSMDSEYLQDVFNKKIESHGGRLDIRNEPNEVQLLYSKFYDLFKSRIASVVDKDNPSQHIVSYIDFIDNRKLNAVAFLHKNTGMIGIYKGLHKKLFEIFKSAIQEKNSLNNSESPINLDIPKEYQKTLYITLWEIAIDFIVNHEIIHISNGHIGWLKNIKGLELYFENKVYSKDMALTLQSLEMDADLNSIGKSIKKAEFIYNDCQKHPEKFPKQVREIYSSFKKTAICQIFAIFIAFHIFEDFTVNVKNFSMRTHPPLQVRQLIFLKLFIGYLKSAKEEGMNIDFDIFNITTEVAKEAQRVYDLITGKGFLGWDIHKKIYQNHVDILDKHLNDLRDEIKPYTKNWRDKLY